MTIHELYDQIHPTKGMKNSGELINFYDDPNCSLTKQTFVDLYESERHTIYIELFSEDKEIHYKSMHMHIDYEFLNFKNKNRRADLKALNRIIELLEVYPGFKNKDIFENSYYIKLRCRRAAENGYLGHINKAKKELKELIKKCPEYADYCNKIISIYPDTADNLMDGALSLSFITGGVFIVSFSIMLLDSASGWPSSGKLIIGMFSIPLVLAILTSLLVVIAKVLRARKKRTKMN